MKLSFLIFIGLVFLLDEGLANRKNVSPKTIVDIPNLGKLRGRKLLTAWSGQNINQFIHIRYGDTSRYTRFQPATMIKPWKQVRNAFRRRRSCPSLQDLKKLRLKESDVDMEDCLYLTVNTKSLNASYPVMVYLHGEFLYDGTTLEASPLYLLEKNVVLVTLQYRLAPFGFISTKSNDIPGNAGLQDVILALEWVQKYIQYFGGDPNRVTLFGQVGGAVMANVLALSPAVPKNLFHRVIYQSASAFTPSFISDNPTPHAEDIAKRGGCKNTSSLESLNECLKQMDIVDLLEAFGEHASDKSKDGVGRFGGLHITVGGPSGILPEQPGELVKNKKIKYYPTMGGVPKNAGTLILKEIFEDYFKEESPDGMFNATTYIDYVIAQTNGNDPEGKWKSILSKKFFNEKQLANGTFNNMIPGMIDACGTIAFKNPILLSLQANAEQLPESTYLYSFDYEGQFNRLMTPAEKSISKLPFDLGVSLTDENLYLFPWPGHAAYLNWRDEKLAKRMVNLWASFAATGVPKAAGVLKWPPMTEKNGPFLHINNSTTIGTDFVEEFTATVADENNGLSLVVDVYEEDDEDIAENNDDDYDDEEEIIPVNQNSNPVIRQLIRNFIRQRPNL